MQNLPDFTVLASTFHSQHMKFSAHSHIDEFELKRFIQMLFLIYFILPFRMLNFLANGINLLQTLNLPVTCIKDGLTKQI